jgi:hypothetical protein
MKKRSRAAPGSKEPAGRRVFWRPRVDRNGKRGVATRMGRGFWYAVVDDIAEDTAVLQIAGWPHLDRHGHLRFDTIYEQPYALDALQSTVDRERARNGQPAADRPLRTGDGFSIQSAARPAEELVGSGFEGGILDITAAAREQAKIAMYGAVARKLSRAEARSRRQSLDRPDLFPRPPRARERRTPGNPAAIAKPEV